MKVLIKRLHKVVSKYKAYIGCEYCGNNKSLSFHHRRPQNKSFNIANALIRGGSKFDGQTIEEITQTVWREVAKCDVACKECHDKIHQQKLWRKPIWRRVLKLVKHVVWLSDHALLNARVVEKRLSSEEIKRIKQFLNQWSLFSPTE